MIPLSKRSRSAAASACPVTSTLHVSPANRCSGSFAATLEIGHKYIVSKIEIVWLLNVAYNVTQAIRLVPELYIHV